MLLGVIDGKVTGTPLGDVVDRLKPLDMSLLELARTLAQ